MIGTLYRRICFICSMPVPMDKSESGKYKQKEKKGRCRVNIREIHLQARCLHLALILLRRTNKILSQRIYIYIPIKVMNMTTLSTSDEAGTKPILRRQ